MNKKQILIDYLKLKVEQERWAEVTKTANELNAIVHIENMSHLPRGIWTNDVLTNVYTGPLVTPKKKRNKRVGVKTKKQRDYERVSLEKVKMICAVYDNGKGGYTQKEVGQMYGIEQQTVSDIVNGKTHGM